MFGARCLKKHLKPNVRELLKMPMERVTGKDIQVKSPSIFLAEQNIKGTAVNAGLAIFFGRGGGGGTARARMLYSFKVGQVRKILRSDIKFQCQGIVRKTWKLERKSVKFIQEKLAKSH